MVIKQYEICQPLIKIKKQIHSGAIPFIKSLLFTFATAEFFFH